MRVMGLDVGSKTIGVSISDELGWTAQGIEVIRRQHKSPDRDKQRLAELIEQYDIHQVVVGLPKNMDGSLGENARHCQSFAEELRDMSGVDVVMWDERLTTRAAQNVLIAADVSRKKRKQVIDKMAAVLILQNYLDARVAHDK